MDLRPSPFTNFRMGTTTTMSNATHALQLWTQTSLALFARMQQSLQHLGTPRWNCHWRTQAGWCHSMPFAMQVARQESFGMSLHSLSRMAQYTRYLTSSTGLTNQVLHGHMKSLLKNQKSPR